MIDQNRMRELVGARHNRPWNVMIGEELSRVLEKPEVSPDELRAVVEFLAAALPQCHDELALLQFLKALESLTDRIAGPIRLVKD